MQRLTVSIVACLFLVGIAVRTTLAGTPVLLTHQGRLFDATAQPVTGSVQLTFRIYDSPAGGTELWTEIHPAVAVMDGLFNTTLGSTVPLSADMLAPPSGVVPPLPIERWLEVQVMSEPPLTPRVRLVSTPYAVAASRVSGDIESQPGELTISNSSGSRKNLDKCTWTVTHRSSEVDGIEAYSEQCDDDSSVVSLSSNRFGRPAINTARVVSGGLGAVVQVTGDDNGDGTAERGLIAGTTSIVGTPSSHLRGWNTGLGQESQFELDADSGGSSLNLDRDSDGDGLADNSSSQTVRTSGVNLAIKTKGTSAHRHSVDLGTGLDSSIISNGSDEDADGRENSVFSSISNHLKCRSSCIFDLDDDGRADHAWSATVDGVRSRTILAADIDLDGIPDNVLTQTADDIGVSSTIQSRLGSGPRQTVSQDGTFSHASHRCATDIDGDGVAEYSAESYSDAMRARINVKQGSFSSGYKARMEANDSSVIAAQDVDSDADGIDDVHVQNYCDATVARIVVQKHLLEPHETRLQVDDAGPSLSLSKTGALRFLASPDSGLLVYDAAGTKKWYADADGDMFADGTLKVDTTSGSHKIDVGGGAYCDGTSWVNASDVHSKENFQPVDGAELLERLERLDITRWNYKENPNSEHIGPTAQDFRAAFGVGSDDKSISTIDPSGIALAAIKELYKQNHQLRDQNEDLRNELGDLKKAVEKLTSRQ